MPVSSVSSVEEEVKQRLLQVVSEQTGYPVDMLELDLDLEADLGIDTVKQVEVFGKVAGRFGLPVPEDLKLSDLNTIAKLAAYIAERAGGGAPADAPAEVVEAFSPVAYSTIFPFIAILVFLFCASQPP